jgi:hypothetical protein
MPCVAVAAVVGGALGGAAAMTGMAIGCQDPKRGAMLLIGQIPVLGQLAGVGHAAAATATTGAAVV